MKNKFDLIICRNVIIYFTPRAKEDVLNKFNDFQEIGGTLFLGYTENLNSLSQYYTKVTKNIFRKIV